MVWNTIAHPKMMHSNEKITYSPIKFADPHKLSFYDIIVSMTGTDAGQPILVKGDFETIKKMLLNDEAVCGAIFASEHSRNGGSQDKTEIKRFVYDSVLNYIGLYPVFGEPLFLLSDNTISETEPNNEGEALGPAPLNPGGNAAFEPLP